MSDGYVLEIELLGLPKMTNRTHGKQAHWAARAAEAKRWKAAVILKVGRRKPRSPLRRATLILTRVSSVSPDPDGLVSGFKHVIDGLVAAGVLENDRVANIGMPAYRWEKSAPKKGCIRIRVEETE